MSIILRYVNIQREDKTLRKAPFIPVHCKTEGKHIVVQGLVDSGADFTIVPKDLAEVLGLKAGELQTTAGIGGSVKARPSKMDIVIVGTREKYPLTLDVLVLEGNDVPLLLGRNGFFENFEVTFKQAEQKIVLKKVK